MDLETQACGRVLLASDIPAAADVVIDGETGLAFRKGDGAHLAARTLEAAADPRRREAIGARARQAAEAHALAGVLTAHERLFREVIARRGGGEEHRTAVGDGPFRTPRFHMIVSVAEGRPPDLGVTSAGGSRTSRSAFPRRFSPSTVTRIARTRIPGGPPVGSIQAGAIG